MLLYPDLIGQSSCEIPISLTYFVLNIGFNVENYRGVYLFCLRGKIADIPLGVFEAKMMVKHKKKYWGAINLATENPPKLSIS